MKKRKGKLKKTKCKPDFTKSCNGFPLYMMGFIGAATYYISSAIGFWNGVLGFLKAIVWPVFLVYELLKLLGA
jgi:hypothetical protein